MYIPRDLVLHYQILQVCQDLWAGRVKRGPLALAMPKLSHCVVPELGYRRKPDARFPRM